MADKIQMEGVVVCEHEDSGSCKIVRFDEGDDPHLYATLVSYDEQRVHPTMSSLEGRRVRITVEILD